jgi:indolepyruvate ferredoxin oxidoreductase
VARCAGKKHALAAKLAALPDDIRGYGHVKESHLAKLRHKWDDLLVQWRNPAMLKQAAE